MSNLPTIQGKKDTKSCAGIQNFEIQKVKMKRFSVNNPEHITVNERLINNDIDELNMT